MKLYRICTHLKAFINVTLRFARCRYGGKYGVQKDRMDKSAVGSSYKADVAKHASQVDASKGFGGKYGVQKDRVDKVSYE